MGTPRSRNFGLWATLFLYLYTVPVGDVSPYPLYGYPGESGRILPLQGAPCWSSSSGSSLLDVTAMLSLPPCILSAALGAALDASFQVCDASPGQVLGGTGTACEM